MRYLILILSLLMVGCMHYETFEKEAVKQTKKETNCKEVLIAMSTMNDNDGSSYIIKTKACGKYYTYTCKALGGCKEGTVRCKRIAVESKPTEDAGELK